MFICQKKDGKGITKPFQIINKLMCKASKHKLPAQSVLQLSIMKFIHMTKLIHQLLAPFCLVSIDAFFKNKGMV